MSSSYYTGRISELVKFGHDRDGKRGFPQIVYGLLCNAQGCPVSIEVFSGNTADPSTLESQIGKMRRRFGLERVVLVGDRGMITSRRIEEQLRTVEGLDWITALRADTIKTLARQGAIEPSLFDERNLAEVRSPDFPGERLVVCRNPALAAERCRKRLELLAATEKKLEEIAAATRRAKRPLRGKDKIAMRVGRARDRYRVGKHFVLEIEEDRFDYRRDEEKIAAEAALDGIYVIRTSVEPHLMAAEDTVRAYKDLAKVERAFRSLKTVDLKIRPIYHWLEPRIRADVFLCMLAYYAEWHLRRQLAPGSLRRRGARGVRVTTRLDRGSRAALTNRQEQGSFQAHRRALAGSQLPDPPRRPRHPHQEPRATRRHRRELLSIDSAHRFPTARPRTDRGHPLRTNCSQNRAT